jgi:MFS family permease
MAGALVSSIALHPSQLNPYWRRNLFAVTAACFIGFSGFTIVMPFLPLYFQQLGVTDVGEIAFWSGISLGVTPAMTALLSPLWGRLSDRFGRKIMVQRSMVSFALIMAATGFVTRPWHVFALRAVQGLFAGYGALALAMAAESAPPGKMAASIGTVQTAQRLGPALGPAIGGVLAGFLGLRYAFIVAASFYALGFVIVAIAYKEQPRTAGPTAGPAAAKAVQKVSFRSVLAFEHFMLVMGVIFAFQFVDRSLGPILPLYLTEIGVTDERAPLVSGLLFSVLAAMAALGHHLCGKVIRYYPPRTIIAVGAGGTAVAVLGFAILPMLAALVVASALFGIAVGAAMTAAYTTAGTVVPHNARATGFGFLTSASLTGVAASPIVAGFIAAVSIRLVFVIDAIVLIAVAGIVLRMMSASLRVDVPRPQPARAQGQRAHDVEDAEDAEEKGTPVVLNDD